MEMLLLTSYRYKEHLDADDLRKLTKAFTEIGNGPSVISHWSRLDGTGGYVLQRAAADPEGDFEVTTKYAPWILFDTVPVTTIEESFPVILRNYG